MSIFSIMIGLETSPVKHRQLAQRQRGTVSAETAVSTPDFGLPIVSTRGWKSEDVLKSLTPGLTFRNGRSERWVLLLCWWSRWEAQLRRRSPAGKHSKAVGI